MNTQQTAYPFRSKIRLSPLAAAKLKLLLMQENAKHPLVIRVILLTTGCRRSSFGLQMTEIRPEFHTRVEQGIIFAWLPREATWIDGLVIDINRENGKFMVYHPNPPFIPGCTLETID
ncbi:hypothetical protein [Thermoflavimicrobium dichotomicum]|uniref:Fe-S cluster assembly iron-binding protein IscA n=1 Tax=Thermoflavimicrobium dichotomicum TaxID=46223 RepID=A0A1I3RPZ6_9BACL|nr:hypothetical protein [Thermoflavimicrobium dichotomicum]SFJ47327.1 Fe-S cluster assembly iron-binding protein IscA [Thermoflavimicrobium dichotomicum]